MEGRNAGRNAERWRTGASWRGSRTVSGGDPPAGDVGLAHVLEPLATPAQNLAVQFAVDESGEVYGVGPDRHVDDDPGGNSGVPDEGVDAGGVAALLLKAPAGARGAVGGGVDRVEQLEKVRQLRSSIGAISGSTEPSVVAGWVWLRVRSTRLGSATLILWDSTRRRRGSVSVGCETSHEPRPASPAVKAQGRHHPGFRVRIDGHRQTMDLQRGGPLLALRARLGAATASRSHRCQRGHHPPPTQTWTGPKSRPAGDRPVPREVITAVRFQPTVCSPSTPTRARASASGLPGWAV